MKSMRFALLSVVSSCALLVGAPAQGVVINIVPVQQDGYVEIDPGEGPQLVAAAVGSTEFVRLAFPANTSIRLPENATTDIEFGVSNLGNSWALDFNIAVEVLRGDFIIGEIFFADSVAADSATMFNLPLQSLMRGPIADFTVRIETEFDGPATAGNFDFYVGGGGGDPDIVASGPIRFPGATIGSGIGLCLGGDTDCDGDMDLQDLFNVQNNFGLTSPPAIGDTDGDGDIDLQDLFNVQNAFGLDPTPAQLAMVPEAATCLLCSGFLLAGYHVLRLQLTQRKT